eukprot:scaffold133701_cov30-Tisochrysis_lutea.AAC.4
MSEMPKTMPNGAPMPSEEQMKSAMDDMKHMAEALKPEKEDPNAELSVERVLLACASCPCMLRAIPKDVPSKIDSLESAMKEQNIPMEWLDQASGAVRRHAVAILWQLNRQRAGLKEKDSALDGATAQHASVAIQIATKLLMQAQMLFPHQRWVPATLAVARASALVANQLWSHTDLEAQVLMAKILKAEGLRRPKLRLEAVCEPKECLPNAKVAVKVCDARRTAVARSRAEHCGLETRDPAEPQPPAGPFSGLGDAPTASPRLRRGGASDAREPRRILRGLLAVCRRHQGRSDGAKLPACRPADGCQGPE